MSKLKNKIPQVPSSAANFANCQMCVCSFRGCIWAKVYFQTDYESKQSWALEVFFNFFNNKIWFFARLIKLIWPGVGFLITTEAEIGY